MSRLIVVIAGMYLLNITLAFDYKYDEKHQHMSRVEEEIGTRRQKQCIKSNSTTFCQSASACCSNNCQSGRCFESNMQIANSGGSPNDRIATQVRNKLPPKKSLNVYYMYFAGAVYAESTLPSLTCSWCGNITARGYKFIGTYQDALADTRAFISLSKRAKTIVVTFRGTINIPNILEDVDLVMTKVDPEDTSDVLVHLGFTLALNSIYGQVLANLTKVLDSHPTYKLVVAGHSLGGALASLFTYRLKVKGLFPNKPLELYTYGCPRVGNKAFANYMYGLDIISVRVVEHADIISAIPPAILGYYFHQTEYWVYNVVANAARYCNRNLYEHPNCSQSVVQYSNLIDHLIYFNVSLILLFEEDPLGIVEQLVINIKAIIPIVLPQLDLKFLRLDLVVKQLQIFIAATVSMQ